MSDRLRIVLMSIALLMVAYAAAASMSPASITPTNAAVAVAFAVVIAVLLVRRRRGDDVHLNAANRLFDGTPRDYEEGCREVLRELGWSVIPTKKSGDYGADVHARKGSVNLAVQCKKYARPVGYTAVKDAHAALKVYACDYACVVAPNGYTAAAKEGARSLGITLLSHSDLARFARSLA